MGNLRLIKGLVVASCIGIAGLAFGQGASGGGSGSGGNQNNNQYQITFVKTGTSTFTFPKWDTNLSAYRLVTNSYDWSTQTWTLDGVVSPGAAAPYEAAWNTNATYTGTASIDGTVKVKVKYVGPSPAPSYMYLMLESHAQAFDDSGASVVNVSASNGQGDPAVHTESSIESHGTHAKRIKLDQNGEAIYSVTVSSSASATDSIGDLKLAAGVTGALDIKALSLFIESYRRTPDTVGTIGPATKVPAWTGDIEHETAQVAADSNGNLSSTISVDHIGSWLSPAIGFSSGTSKGSRIENSNTSSPYEVNSITLINSYSLEQLVGMRKTPDTITVTGHQTDTFSTNPGPFNSSISVKVWAPERIFSTQPRTVESTPILKFPDGSDEIILYPGGSRSFANTKTQTFSEKAICTLSGGFSYEVNPTEFTKLGVKFDTSCSLGTDNTNGTTYTETTGLTCPSATVPYRFYQYFDIEHYHVDRSLARYSAQGYQFDDFDTVLDVDKPYVAYILHSEPYYGIQ